MECVFWKRSRERAGASPRANRTRSTNGYVCTEFCVALSRGAGVLKRCGTGGWGRRGRSVVWWPDGESSRGLLRPPILSSGTADCTERQVWDAR